MDSSNNTIQIEELPLPAFILDKSNGGVLYANSRARKYGIARGDVLADFPQGISLEEACSKGGREMITLQINQQTLSAQITAGETVYDNIQALIVVVTQTKQDSGESAVTTGIVNIFTKGALHPLYAFLALTAQYTGAFCASAYERDNSRYKIKAEWRKRRSVCVPVLSHDFDDSPQKETERLRKLKSAKYAFSSAYIKKNGTGGAAVYFFDEEADVTVQKQIENYVRLYKTFAPDMPKTKIVDCGLNSLEHGFAIWDTDSMKLLYKNKAYAELFGKDCARMVSEMFRADLRDGINRSSEYTDARGRCFHITHAPMRRKKQTIVATLLTDVTKYKQAETRLEQMAKTDALTGLLNRRAGLEMLKSVYSRCKRLKTPLTVCFADIDGLKRINDTCGHGTGDAMIRAAADVLKNHVEESGYVCRMGGDEFVLILPDIRAAQAKLLAIRMERAVAKCCANGRGGITMSFGFMQAGYGRDETAETLISVADSDMYREKAKKSR